MIGVPLAVERAAETPLASELIWETLPDGACRVRVHFAGWDSAEAEQVLKASLDNLLSILTYDEERCLRGTPSQFLALSPRPESLELVACEREPGPSTFVLTLAAAPSRASLVTHVAVVPSLVQLQRQLDALAVLAAATDEGPLGPLRALVGASRIDLAEHEPAQPDGAERAFESRVDEHQRAAIRRALATPHFAVVQGPPGSGKTQVIRSVIEQAVARGNRVLVVSPTHVAVDNVVERLVGNGDAAALAPQTLPIRFAARQTKLSRTAAEYWVGPKRELRGATIARRLEARLKASVPFANALFAKEQSGKAGHAPLSAAVARESAVICGTPIGLLSCEHVRNASAGGFDLLIVDEASKILLSEFLVVAVKAKRWLVVGDPMQLPPFLDAEECAATLDDVLPPELELLASVGAFLDTMPAKRREARLLVIAANAKRMVAAIRAHVEATILRDRPTISLLGDTPELADVQVSGPEVLERGGSMEPTGASSCLVERGLCGSPPIAILPRERAGALLFQYAARVYHTQPWSQRVRQRVRSLGCKNGMPKLLPTCAALEVLAQSPEAADVATVHDAVARRYAINAVSVYDWLLGVPSAFDCTLLDRVGRLMDSPLRSAVEPYVTVLKKQYRMHASLSRVPRELFYGGEALIDHRTDPGCRVELLQVDSTSDLEENAEEVERVRVLIDELRASGEGGEVLVLTAYRAQQRALTWMLAGRSRRNLEQAAEVEVCTLDSCQGREADNVIISLVRGRPSAFFESPKRWNVALTRAKQRLFIVGDLGAYRAEAGRARGEVMTGRAGRPGKRPLMSVLARIVEAYDHQIATSGGAR
jgi:hypothetical protein